MYGDIVQAKPMMEGIRPELGRKIGTAKHGTQGITNSLMGTLAGAILMGGSRGSGLNKVSRILKQLHNFLTTTQVATLIQANILVGHISRETMKDKPTIKKVQRRSLVAEALAIQGATVMISDEAVTSLTIETN
jgi:hypothetical protein